MRYSVDWLPAAEEELASLWLNAPDRNAITRAAHAIDLRLQDEPEEAGESRPDGRRIVFAPPLGVIFRVIPGGRLVQVVHVWQFGTRGQR